MGSTRAYIDSEIGEHAKLVLIANNLLSKLLYYVESVFQFMNDTYKLLSISFKNPNNFVPTQITHKKRVYLLSKT